MDFNRILGGKLKSELITSKNILSRCCTALSHVNPDTNRPRMVNVGTKDITRRLAHARCIVKLPKNVTDLLSRASSGGSLDISSPKGPVFTTAIIAGVMAAKRTSNIIPFCHPLPLDSCDIKVHFEDELQDKVTIDCFVETSSKTGVEMEALVGASTSALTIYDMCKALSHDIIISDLRLISKSGGKHDFSNADDEN